MRRTVIGFSALVLIIAAGASPANAVTCTITGTPGEDILEGTPGNDVICGLGAHDVLYGRQGNDVLLGGNGDDHLYGGSGRDELRGGDGDDLLRGEDGADRAYGGPGADYFRATQGSAAGVVGDGPDFYSGGPGPDIAEYYLRTTGVRVSLDGAANDGAPGEGDQIGVLVNGVSDVESINSGTGNDVLTGDGQANFLVSRGGTDRLSGFAGPDTFDTLDNAGGDVVEAGSGTDYCAIDAGDTRSSCETVFP